jgi:hypothetical protein
MYEPLETLLAEGGPLLARTVGALLAGALGVVVEFNGAGNLAAGHQVVGLWMAGLGGVLLLVAYVLGTDVLDALGGRASEP